MEYSDKENNNKARSYNIDRHNHSQLSFKDGRLDHVDYQKNKELNEIVRNGFLKPTIQQSTSVIQRLKVGNLIAGHFINIPSGVLTPDWIADENVLRKYFDMKAVFTTPRTLNQEKGEYRQYVKGYFARNGVHEPHVLIPPENLEENRWHEDGDASGGYGHHDIAMGPGNQFIETPEGSESYNGNDSPESNPIGQGYESTEMHLDFCGELISADEQGNPNKILCTSFWSVYGRRP